MNGPVGDHGGNAYEKGSRDFARRIHGKRLADTDPEIGIMHPMLCRDPGWDVPEVYIPLLFLMLDGQCALRQDEFFGDVYVQVCKVGE